MSSLYHCICIADQNSEVYEKVFSNIKQLLLEHKVQITSSEVFVRKVFPFRKYKKELAAFMVCKVEGQPHTIERLLAEIRRNVIDILVLRFILLSGFLKEIPNRVME